MLEFGRIVQQGWIEDPDAAISFLGAFATFVAFAWRDRTEYRVSADEVARIDRENRSARRAALAQLGAAE